eukprot:TRINITY_DN66533_c6_g1_i3.p2 TRINITY_DN66533_c6_g1~~TRINITY_DN66533_c6_g1_i3.p2  ORF type:complete len:141 (-),score=22.92 TRINITY_DN66533_c6_g1_i3:58-423(-)
MSLSSSSDGGSASFADTSAPCGSSSPSCSPLCANVSYHSHSPCSASPCDGSGCRETAISTTEYTTTTTTPTPIPEELDTMQSAEGVEHIQHGLFVHPTVLSFATSLSPVVAHHRYRCGVHG